MAKRVIYLEQEREIKSMAGSFSLNEIAGSLSINYKTLHAWCKRNKISPLSGYAKPTAIKDTGLPSPYVIPGIIREQLSVEEVRALVKIKNHPTLDHIKNIVAEYYSVTIESIDCKSHKREFVWPRHVIFFFASNITVLSLKTIGLETGCRDHTTVIHGIGVVQDIIESDKDKAREVREIGGIIKNLISNES